MNKKIYHGSNRIVRVPNFGAGRPYNDFGLGFYCTEQPQYAAEWAVGRDTNGFVSSYSIDCNGLSIINLCGPQYTPLHWLALLFNYREFDMASDCAYKAREYISKFFRVDHQSCDCVIGYRADNRLFMFAQDFLDGKLSYQCLKRSLIEDDSGRQFVLKSNRAFDRVSFTGYVPASAAESFPVYSSRELHAIKRMQHEPSGDLLITDLIEREVRPYDSLL